MNRDAQSRCTNATREPTKRITSPTLNATRVTADVFTAEADVEAKRAVKTMEKITELSELNQSAIERPTDVELRLRIAALCDELGMKKLAVMWKKAAESCRQFAPLPEPTPPSATQATNG